MSQLEDSVPGMLINIIGNQNYNNYVIILYATLTLALGMILMNFMLLCPILAISSLTFPPH